MMMMRRMMIGSVADCASDDSTPAWDYKTVCHFHITPSRARFKATDNCVFLFDENINTGSSLNTLLFTHFTPPGGGEGSYLG